MNAAFLDLLSKAHDVKLVIDGIAISLHVEQPLFSASEAGAEGVMPNMFRLVDGKWHIRFNGREIIRRPSVALTYTHELLKNPNGPISATDLLTTHYGESPTVKSKKEIVNEGYGELRLSAQSTFADPISPSDALRRLTKHLNDLNDELADLQDEGDQALVFQKKQEIEQAEDYLRQSKFGNHPARFSGRADRDRKSVSLAIARAIANIAKDHPALARHLDNSIRTGWQCSYAPETEVKWLL